MPSRSAACNATIIPQLLQEISLGRLYTSANQLIQHARGKLSSHPLRLLLLYLPAHPKIRRSYRIPCRSCASVPLPRKNSTPTPPPSYQHHTIHLGTFLQQSILMKWDFQCITDCETLGIRVPPLICCGNSIWVVIKNNCGAYMLDFLPLS